MKSKVGKNIILMHTSQRVKKLLLKIKFFNSQKKSHNIFISVYTVIKNC